MEICWVMCGGRRAEVARGKDEGGCLGPKGCIHILEGSTKRSHQSVDAPCSAHLLVCLHSPSRLENPPAMKSCACSGTASHTHPTAIPRPPTTAAATDFAVCLQRTSLRYGWCHGLNPASSSEPSSHLLFTLLPLGRMGRRIIES